jgi:hypothetical protein
MIFLITGLMLLTDSLIIENRMRIRIVRIVHLVTDAPHNDARMVAVAFHHGRDITLRPFLKKVRRALKSGIALVPSFNPLFLGIFPLVKRLIHH